MPVVELDPWQTIVALTAPASDQVAKYLIMSTALERSGDVTAAAISTDTFSGVGVEPNASKNYSSIKYTAKAVDFMSNQGSGLPPLDYPTTLFHFDALFDEDGGSMSSDGTLFAAGGLSGVPGVIGASPGGSGIMQFKGSFSNSDTGHFELQWGALGGPVSWPGPLTFLTGPPALHVYGEPFDDETVDEYNPEFPSPISNFTKTAPVTPLGTPFGMSLGSVELAAIAAEYDGSSYEPIGYLLTMRQFGLRTGLYMSVLCERNSS